MNFNRGQKGLLLLALLFFGPVLVAFLLVNNMHWLGDYSTKNHGELVEPARPLADVALSTEKNQSFRFSALRGKWIMVYLGHSACGSECADALYKMRQARLVQGEELERIERLYISIDGNPDASLRQVMQQHVGMGLVRGDKAVIDQLLQQFGSSRQQISRGAAGLYLVDPLGNLMMRYPRGYAAKGLVQDLQLLLKASYVG